MNAEAVYLKVRFKGVPTFVGMKRESGDPEEGESGAVPATVIRYISLLSHCLSPKRDGKDQGNFGKPGDLPLN